MQYISGEQVDRALDWPEAVEALEHGHRHPKAKVGDLHLAHGGNDLLNRAAWIDGLGLGLKTVSVFPENPRKDPPLPTVQGAFVLFDERDGSVRALIDGIALTLWKTASDSALGSKLLSRTDARSLLMVGAGALAEPLTRAHLSVRPGLEDIRIWNRTAANAERLASALANSGLPVRAEPDVEVAARQADIICCATTSRQPVILGDWLKPGAHLDLVGAFTPDGRETDDTAMTRGRVFVDSRETTMDKIGEIMIPLANGTLSEDRILGDLYDLVAGGAGRLSPEDITIFKNGGGAHLDLMTAIAIHQRCL